MGAAMRRRLRAALLLVVLAGCGPSAERPAVVVPVAEESCLRCHDGMTGFSPFHQPAAIGCVSCHRGDAVDTTEAGSHAGMIRVPGNLATAAESCGGASCHAETVARVRTSLMATGRGIVAVDRWVFGEQPTPDGTDGLADLRGGHADTHLRQLCYSCHLGYEKEAPGPVHELSRGGGCVACHVAYHPVRDAKTHPALTIRVTDDHCFGCHSRSGRISTNYEGWQETLLTPAAVPGGDTTYRVLGDDRVFVRQPEDVHHAAGLACIDCHTARETMGDGRIYRHQEEATEVRCETCHTAAPPAPLAWSELDREAQMTVVVRSGQAQPGRRFARTAKGGAMTNVFTDATGRLVLEGKLDGRLHPLRPPVDACAQPGHERLSCQSCHSSWVTQCVGCHTQRDAEGAWREFASDFLSGPPTLGVRADTAGGVPRVEPFAPGMIMTLGTGRRPVTTDVAELVAEGTFHRLFAPAVPHTTTKAGRSCESCHNDPVALGYGRGRLALSPDAPARWTFAPTYEPLRDGLPADAWIPFLGVRSGPVATRRDARPFSRIEQQRILRVGACLTCHPAGSADEARLYDDFARALTRMTPACRATPVETARE